MGFLATFQNKAIGGGEEERRRGGEEERRRGGEEERRFLVMRVLEIQAVGEGGWKRRGG